MPKDRKKDPKKDKQSDDLLDNAAKSLKKFRKVTKNMTSLTTGQKVVGGIALLAAGLTYLARQQASADAKLKALPGAEAAEAALTKLTSAENSPRIPELSESSDKSAVVAKAPTKRPAKRKKPKQSS